MKLTLILCAAIVVAFSVHCGPKVMVPPRIDLTQHEVIGVIEFECTNEGKLASMTTDKFIEACRRDQGMVHIKELGTESEVLDAVGHDKLSPDAFKAIGEKYDVATVFSGELVVSDVRPDISLGPLFIGMTFSAEVDASLNAKMVETGGGASVWSGSNSATREVGHVSLFGGKHFVFDAENPDRAYGKLVDKLVERTTQDFRVTWKRQ